MTDLTLTVGDTGGGRIVAVISSGGHPQRPGSGQCTICALEIVTGWSRKRVRQWFEAQQKDRPWETRQ